MKRYVMLLVLLWSGLAFGGVDIFTQSTGCSGWEPDISVNPTNVQNVMQVPFGTCGRYTTTGLEQTPTWLASQAGTLNEGDPHVEFTANGNLFASGIVFTNQFGIDFELQRIYKSTNGGATWTQVAQPISSGGCGIGNPASGTLECICGVDYANGVIPLDFDKFGADRNPTSSFANRLYLSVAVLLTNPNAPYFGNCDTDNRWRVFTYSSDAGATWSQPVPHTNTAVFNDSWYETSDYAVRPSGTVTVATEESGSGCIGLATKTSTNGGVTWANRVCAINNPSGTGSYPDVGAIPAGSTDHLMQITADPDTDGTLYMVFAGLRNWTGSEYHIWFIKSTNGGTTWSAPVKVDSVAFGAFTNSWQNQRGVKMSVSSDDGRIDVIWDDGRNTDSTHVGGGDYFYASSTDGGATFNETRLSSPVFGYILQAPASNSGDYIRVRSSGMLAWASYDGLDLSFVPHNYLARIVPGH